MGVSKGTTLDGTDFNTSDILTMEFTNIETAHHLEELTSVNISTYKFDGPQGNDPIGETGWWTAYVHIYDDQGNVTNVQQVGETTQFWIGDLNGDEIVVNPGGVFDTVELRGAGGNGWAIDAITFTNSYDGVDHAITYDFLATDADYDTAAGTFTVNFNGNDGLTAGDGLDALLGGGGVDIFNFTAQGGEGINEILDFNPAEDRLSFFDLLDMDDDGDVDNVDVALFTDSVNVEVVNDGHDLELTIPGLDGGDTTITLAGVGDDYAGSLNNGDNLSLTELINTVSDDAVTHINVDTYAS
jgi:hypothetical protein